MSHDRPPQLQGHATLLSRQALTPRFVRLQFHAPALAAMAVHKPAHALHVWFGPDARDKAVRRVFTLRQFDSGSATLAVDVLLHGSGLASQWAQRARVGDTLAMAGPRSGFAWPLGGEWLLAVVDESAMPALASIIEQTPAARPIHALLALRHESERAYFDALERRHRNLNVTHLLHTGAPASPMPGILANARWPAGPGVAFVAGESDWVAHVRSWLEDMPDMDWLHIHASGYWSEGRSAYRHG